MNLRHFVMLGHLIFGALLVEACCCPPTVVVVTAGGDTSTSNVGGGPGGGNCNGKPCRLPAQGANSCEQAICGYAPDGSRECQLALIVSPDYPECVCAPTTVSGKDCTTPQKKTCIADGETASHWDVCK